MKTSSDPIFAQCRRSAPLGDLRAYLEYLDRLARQYRLPDLTMTTWGELLALEPACEALLTSTTSPAACKRRVWQLITRFRSSIPKFAETPQLEKRPRPLTAVQLQAVRDLARSASARPPALSAQESVMTTKTKTKTTKTKTKTTAIGGGITTQSVPTPKAAPKGKAARAPLTPGAAGVPTLEEFAARGMQAQAAVDQVLGTAGRAMAAAGRAKAKATKANKTSVSSSPAAAAPRAAAASKRVRKAGAAQRYTILHFQNAKGADRFTVVRGKPAVEPAVAVATAKGYRPVGSVNRFDFTIAEWGLATDAVLAAAPKAAAAMTAAHNGRA